MTSYSKVIQIFHYQQYLPWQDVIRVLDIATSSAFTYDADTLVGDQPIKSPVAGVMFVLVPKKEMTWRR